MNTLPPKYLLNKGNSILERFVWVLFFVLSFRVLARLPMGSAGELLFLFLLGTLILFFFKEIFVDFKNGKIRYITLMLIPLLAYPIVSALQAQKVFGQPVLYGVISLRQQYLLLISFAIPTLLAKGKIYVQELEEYFVLGMYTILSIMFFFYLFIDPARFEGTDFVMDTLNKGWLYEFPNGISVGILIYSVIRVWLDNRYEYLLPMGASFIYFIVYAQDRSQLLFLGTTLLLLFLLNLKMQKKILHGLAALISLFAAVTLAALVKPELIDKYVKLYSDAFTFFTGEYTTDYSTRIRVVETAIAVKGFEENPWLGNGFLSGQWNDGYLGLYRYFYPADIGIMGNLYVFGIIGTALVYLPYICALIWVIQTGKQRNRLYLTCVYGLLFTFLDLSTAASNIQFIGLSAFFIGVIYYFRFHHPDENSLPEKLL